MDQLRHSSFNASMRKALEEAKKVLNGAKLPVFAEDAAHSYDDKFALVEHAVNSGLGASLTVLQAMGMDETKLSTIMEWAKDGGTVTLRFESSESTNFKETKTRKEDSAVQHESTFMGVKSTSKTVTTITEHFWKFTHNYRIIAYRGTDSANGLVLQERASSTILITTGKEAISPRKENEVNTPRDVEIGDLIRLINKERQGVFSIDRTDKDCATPRRNKDVEKILGLFSSTMRHWFQFIHRYMQYTLFQIQKDHEKYDLNFKDIFVPILPLIQEEAKDGESAKLVSSGDMEKYFAHQLTGVRSAMREVGTTYPSPTDSKVELISSQEVGLCLLSVHFINIATVLQNAVNHIEEMLRAQLMEAVGKHIDTSTINEYMPFHLRKLFQKGIVTPFSYDVKRKGFAPEGTLTIEDTHLDGDRKEIYSFVRKRTEMDGTALPMRFKLGAAVSVEMKGSQYVHGYVAHQFTNRRLNNLKLVARARQFSTFVLLLGTIASKDEFLPKYSMILSNKDSVLIPLILDPLPSAAAFRDAIESLSPEQQRFAKAVRAMQLESTLFAAAIVEVKPQMEKLLNLPAGSLTKEIKLTQDLIKLFIEFQIPCDLVTFDGDESDSVASKLDRVKGHVKAMMDMINESKDEVIQEKKKEAEAEFYGNIAEGDLSLHQEVDDGRAVDYVMALNSAPTMKSRGKQIRMKKSAMRKSGMMMQAQTACMDVVAPMARQPVPPPAPCAASAPPSGGVPNQQFQQQQQQQEKPTEQGGEEQEELSDRDDLTKLPAQMDQKFEKFDPDAALRSTKVKLAKSWTLKRFKNLLSKSPEESVYEEDELKVETNKAMDLLDALSRSGDIPLIQSQLHVFMATTHCFLDTVIDTLVKKNVNPIEKIERSCLLVASSVLDRPVPDLLQPGQEERITKTQTPFWE